MRHGIEYVVVNEAYTSQTDALALDEIKSQPYGKSRRVKRGSYQSSNGTLINADVVGAINIMRKAAGDSCVDRTVCSGPVNRPQGIRLAYETSDKLLSNQIVTAAAQTGLVQEVGRLTFIDSKV